jgi:hypothetical protein
MQAAHAWSVPTTVSNRVNMQATHMHGVSEQLSLAAGPYRRRLQLLKVSLQKRLTVMDKFTALVSQNLVVLKLLGHEMDNLLTAER